MVKGTAARLLVRVEEARRHLVVQRGRLLADARRCGATKRATLNQKAVVIGRRLVVAIAEVETGHMPKPQRAARGASVPRRNHTAYRLAGDELAILVFIRRGRDGQPAVGAGRVLENGEGRWYTGTMKRLMICKTIIEIAIILLILTWSLSYIIPALH